MTEMSHSLFYHLLPFRFRAYNSENLRVICLGHSQVKISVELLTAVIVMRMYYPRFRNIFDGIATLTSGPRINHVLIKNRFIGKTTNYIIYVTPVHGTYI